MDGWTDGLVDGWMISYIDTGWQIGTKCDILNSSCVYASDVHHPLLSQEHIQLSCLVLSPLRGQDAHRYGDRR